MNLKSVVAGLAISGAIVGAMAKGTLASVVAPQTAEQAKATELAQIRKGFAPAIAQLKLDEARLAHVKPLSVNAQIAIHSWISAAYALDSLDSPSSSANAVELLHWGDHEVNTLDGVEHGHPDPYGFVRSQTDLFPYEDIYNVYPDDEYVISGSYPSLAGLRWLKSRGVTAVVNFTDNDAERARAAKVGLHYYDLAFPDHQPPTRAQVAEFLKIVAQEKALGGKVYTHCIRGIGRDHTMVACYLMADKHMTAAEAIQDGLSKVPNWALDQAPAKPGEDPPSYVKKYGHVAQPQFAFLRDYGKSAATSSKK